MIINILNKLWIVWFVVGDMWDKLFFLFYLVNIWIG